MIIDMPASRDKWNARWIWAGAGSLIARNRFRSDVDPEVFNRFILLRKTFDLLEDPTEALLRVAADSRCVVWVNGAEVARGPIRADPWRQRSIVTSVVHELHEGANVIAALVRYYGRPTGQWLPTSVAQGLAGGAFAAELRVDEKVLGTDESWRGMVGECWSRGRPPEGLESFFVESLDARRLPESWREVGFDDGDWPPATVLSGHNGGSHGPTGPPSDPYGPLDPSPIPPLAGEIRHPHVLAIASGGDLPPSHEDPRDQVATDLECVSWIPQGGDGDTASGLDDGLWLVALDFGQTVAGSLLLTVDGPAGTQVDLVLGEESPIRPGGAPFVGHHAMRYIARGSGDRHETMDPMGGRYAVAAVRSTGPVELDVAIRERLFPRPENSARFSCSDPALDEIFQMGVRTVDLCAWDAYIDCPTREARAWIGDFVVHQMVHLATCGDWSLARWHPQLGANPRTDGMLPMAAISNLGDGDDLATYIPDWALHWIRGVHNLMRYTGDRALVGELMPVAERVLRWFAGYQRADGLLRYVPGWVLIDWSNIHVLDTSAVLNALWARALRDYAEMASWLDDQGRAQWAETHRLGIAGGFETFWDENRGLYRDQRLNGVVRPHASQHASAAAICGGLVPSERVAELAERIVNHPKLERAAPTIEAFQRGDFMAGGNYIRNGNPEPDWDPATSLVAAQPFFRYVVHDALVEAGRADLIASACLDWRLFVEAGEQTCPETWVGGTHCHAWSATPTRDLIVATIGIRPGRHGFSTALIEPALGYLDWAEATVPTPAGPLHVRATRTGLDIDSPIPAEVRLAGRTHLVEPGRHVLN